MDVRRRAEGPLHHRGRRLESEVKVSLDGGCCRELAVLVVDGELRASGAVIRALGACCAQSKLLTVGLKKSIKCF